MAIFAVGALWFGWSSHQLRASAHDYESVAWLDLTPVVLYFAGLIGIGIAAIMVATVAFTELVSTKSPWADGASARLGIAIAVVWLPFSGLCALFGSLSCLVISVSLLGTLTIGLHVKSGIGSPTPSIIHEEASTASPPPPQTWSSPSGTKPDASSPQVEFAPVPEWHPPD